MLYFQRPALPASNGGDPSVPTKLTGDVGHFSTVFNTPVKKLEFIDWTTAPIGIDNLEVNTPPVRRPQVNVPEPSSFVLLAPWLLAMGGAAFLRHRRRA